LAEVPRTRLRLRAFRKLTSVLCSIRRFSAGQQTRITGAAVTNNNVAWPRSDPDVSSPDQIQGNATYSERLGSCSRCHFTECRCVGATLYDDTRGRCGRHDNSTTCQREKVTDVFRVIQLAIVVEAAHIPMRRCDLMVGPRALFWSEHFALTGLVPFAGT